MDDATGAAVGGVTSGKEEERTAISEFFDIYKGMNPEELEIPQSMRGRDFRIISEEVLVPDALQVSAEADKEDKGTNKKGGGKRGRGKGRGKKQKKRNYQLHQNHLKLLLYNHNKYHHIHKVNKYIYIYIYTYKYFMHII